MILPDITAIRVYIGNSADIQALILETPASLTLNTPTTSVKIQVLRTEIDDSRVLPPGCKGHYSHR